MISLKKLTLFSLLSSFAIFFQACQNPAGQDSKTVDAKPTQTPIDSVFAQYYDEGLRLDPLNATFAGDHRFDDQFPNYLSQAYRQKQHDYYQHDLDLLKNYTRDSLSHENQLSYDLLTWECNIHLEGLKFKAPYLMPINQFWSQNLTMAQLAGGDNAQPFKTVKDYEAWHQRVEGFLAWCDTALVNMKKGIKEGYVLPRALTVKVIPQFEALDHGPVEEHMFYAPIKKMPDSFSQADKDKLTAEYKKMVGEEIIPEFKKLHDFLVNEYLPASRKTDGIASLPNGSDLYKFYIKEYTTTELSPDSIYNLGLSEVDRITKAMNKIKDEVGYKGDLKSFFNYVRNDKDLMPYTTADQVLDHFRHIDTIVEAHVSNLFDVKPKTKFEIRETEKFREASASVEYEQGSLDGSRPGILFVPVPDPRHYNNFEDEDLFLHEAIPGHHYQLSLQQEKTSLPKFRRTLYYSAFGEGWALYSESLGKELGLYKDPYQRFGNLSMEMHRAIRLVVDVGMAMKGWSREKAIQYSLDNEADSKADITAEIERYMAIPGQALSYKIGQLTILHLRDKAENELGDKFDIKKFHDQVIKNGVMPLETLENQVNEWIKTEKQAGQTS